MILDLPWYVYTTFSISLLYVLVWAYYAHNSYRTALYGVILWGILNAILTIQGFYENTQTIPPRLILLMFPMPIILMASFFSKRMKQYLVSLDVKKLTYLHIVRIPVELVLYWVFVGGYIPEIMTFEGRNLDILVGVTAPIIAIVAFRHRMVNRKILWIWNIVSMGFLINIFIHASLSAPTILQQFGFDQPNVAILRFPFILLPTMIVPLVLIAHMATFIQLYQYRDLR